MVTFVLILLIASLVAIIFGRLKVSFSVGLGFAGMVITVFPSGVELPLTRDLIFNIFLSPPVFEAAMELCCKPFWRDLRATAVLVFSAQRHAGAGESAQ